MTRHRDIPSPSVMDVLSGRSELDADTLLDPGIRFHSPYADYHGREQVAALLAVIPSVLQDVRVDGAPLDDHRRTVTLFHARVGEHAVDGVVHERVGEDGRTTELTLFLRPLAGVRAAVAAMADRMK
jgi:hypothetical protein